MLGRRNNKWTKGEEEALLAGVAKHGLGSWSEILDDPEFAAQLVNRTNVNLKDKWRNLKNRAMPMKEESKKTRALESATSPLVSNGLSPNSSSDISNESWCCEMVFEAISTINDEYGSDFSGILRFIEERHEVPQNFKKLLSNSLRLLVSQDKLDKRLNRYKISTRKATNDSVVSETSEETQEVDSAAANKEPKQIKEFSEEIDDLNRHKISQIEKNLFEAAPEIVAAKLAESHNKSWIAAEATKEAQELQNLAEESQLMLQICLEIHQECALGKEVLHVKSFSS